MQTKLSTHRCLGFFCLATALALGRGDAWAQADAGGGGGLAALIGAAAARGRGNSSTSVATAARVTAVADEFSNSLIVSGSEDQLKAIKDLIDQIDKDVKDLTVIRVFPLKNADADETATMLANLFPDPTSGNQGNTRGGGVRFGGAGGFGGGGRGAAATTGSSERAKKQGRVLAVSDQRTRSVIVSAAKDLMPQIELMVAQLDASTARKQKVFVYTLENANPQDVNSVLTTLFQSTTARSTTQNNTTDPLRTRQTQNAQNQTPATIGTTGTGGGGGRGN